MVHFVGSKKIISSFLRSKEYNILSNDSSNTSKNRAEQIGTREFPGQMVRQFIC